MKPQSGDIYVFTGPTLAAFEVQSLISDAIICPPVRMGDLCLLQRKKPGTIVIVDGFYERMPAVWHKEILLALDHGWKILGASSLGALRASELSSLGMVGYGKIFEGYQSGRFLDDDDVAVLHHDEARDFAGITEAQVNVIFSAERWVEKGLINFEVADHLVKVSKTIHYKARTWKNIFKKMFVSNESGALAVQTALECSGVVNQKKDDAMLALLDLGNDQIDFPRMRKAANLSSVWLRCLMGRTIGKPFLLAPSSSLECDEKGSLLRFDRELYFGCSQMAKLLAISSAATHGAPVVCSADHIKMFFVLFRNIKIAAKAAELWMPILIRIEAMGFIPDELAVRQFAARFIDRLGIDSEGSLQAWLQASNLESKDSQNLFKNLYIYEQVVNLWNINFAGIIDVDIKIDWWSRAFQFLSETLELEINEGWARKRRDREWNMNFTEPSYFRFGFDGGISEFNKMARQLG